MEISKSVDITFHGTDFIITITSDQDQLVLEAEESRTGRRWRGDYTSKYIEDVTTKTGNFKKFTVFVRMLLNSLENASESVFCDLLTYQDLEMLKSRKGGKSSNAVGSSQGFNQSNSKMSQKRYLILTYAVEFDRVHYPLPLNYDENPDPSALQATIRRLREQNEDLRNVMPSGEIDVPSILQENERLKSEVTKLEHIQSVNGSNRKGAVEIDALARDKKALDNRIEEIKFESAKEVRKLKRVNDDLQKELDRIRKQMDDVINKLEAEGDERLEAKTIKRNNEKLKEELERAQNAARKYKKEYEGNNDELIKLRTDDRRQKQRIKQLETELEQSLKSRGARTNTSVPARQPAVPRQTSAGRTTAQRTPPGSRVGAGRSPAARSIGSRSPASSRGSTPPQRAQRTPPGRTFGRTNSGNSRAGSAGSRGSAGSSGSEASRRGVRSPAYSNGSSGSVGYRRGSPGSVGSRGSNGSNGSAGSRRAPGQNYVSPYGNRRMRPPQRNNYMSDSSDDEKRRNGPARRGQGNRQKSPNNVADIDDRLNRLQDLLKFAKSSAHREPLAN